MAGPPQAAMSYGAVIKPAQPRAVFALRPLLGEIALCVGAPSLLFALLLSVLSLSKRPHAVWLCWLSTFAALLGVLAASRQFRGQMLSLKASLQSGGAIAWCDVWPSLLCVGSAVAWVLALWLGPANWATHVQHLQQYTALGNYVDVDPAYYLGAEMLDAGRVFFEPSCWVDRSKAVAFKTTQADDVYCVAPITSPLLQAAAEKPAPPGPPVKPLHDFWAVGVNCCTYANPGGSFKCGADDPHAGSGLRVLDESELEHFWAAVKQAEATLGVQAPNPVMLKWTRDASKNVQAFWTDAVDRVMFGICTFLLVQTTAAAACAVYLWQKTHALVDGQPPMAAA